MKTPQVLLIEILKVLKSEGGKKILSVQKKRTKTSKVWNDFVEIDLPNGSKKVQCIHCNQKLALQASKSTTSYSRHLKSCTQFQNTIAKQSKLNYQPVDSGIDIQCESISVIHDGKFDMIRMREGAAHWVMMHEHPFSILEEEGFNLMQKRGMPEWKKISRQTCSTDCFKVYDIEKKKLKALLKGISKISLTTDLWSSKPQKIEYLVLTGHFIDFNWKLQKRVLSFVHIPPPRRGVEIADCIYKCLKEWELENKVSPCTYLIITKLSFY